MPLAAALSANGTARDAKAFAAFLDAQAEVDTKRGLATTGYCMRLADGLANRAAVPGRVRAAATFHDGGLVTDQPDSPHR